MAKNNVEYFLSKYQDHFINSDDEVVAIIGAKGSSKTWSLARFVAVQVARAYEMDKREQGLVMLNSRQQVIDVFEQELVPLFIELGWNYTFNAQLLNVKILNTTIHLRSADPDAVKKIESIVYNWGAADEASYYPDKSLSTFVSRIRKLPALKRITSMPSEPDAYMYSFLEKLVDELGGKMYEITLKDNPDKAFRERYEKMLRATYSGKELERYLYAKRVSLEGEGIFAIESHMRTAIDIERDDELLLSWDFNIEYCAVTGWQKIGYNKEGMFRIGCVASWQLKEKDVEKSAEYLCELLKGHRGRIVLHGDASGENRSAAVTYSMWKMVRNVFAKYFPDYKYIVPKANPPVKDTIQCLNWALRSDLIEFNEKEKNCYNSLANARADRYGEIDKSQDYKGGYGSRSHETDTARYAVFSYYDRYYPGGKGRLFIV